MNAMHKENVHWHISPPVVGSSWPENSKDGVKKKRHICRENTVRQARRLDGVDSRLVSAPIKTPNYKPSSSVSRVYCALLEANEVDPRWIRTSALLPISLLRREHGCSVANKIL